MILDPMRNGYDAPPVAPRLGARGPGAAYAAAILAFAYAAVSLYWTLGGKLLLATVGGAWKTSRCAAVRLLSSSALP